MKATTGVQSQTVCGKELHISTVPSLPLRVLFTAPEVLFLWGNNKEINQIIITFIQVEMSFGDTFGVLLFSLVLRVCSLHRLECFFHI